MLGKQKGRCSMNEEEQAKLKETRSDSAREIAYRLLWVVVPIVVGWAINMAADVPRATQVVVWCIIALVILLGLLMHHMRIVDRQKIELEKARWVLFDKRFDELDQRFNEVDRRFDEVDKANRLLLRNELVSAHREWVEEKGYITLEALEYIDETYACYHDRGGNGSGTRLWEDIHNLPIRENRALK